MEHYLEIKHIDKFFGKKQILKDVSLEVNSGEVFGFLGPNGAGKSTTIKMIVGLLCIDRGEILVCGENIEKHFEKAMANIGAIVENPETYNGLSGMINLQMAARMRDGVTQERIDEVVELVGLTKRIHDKVKKYSLGMKQRLGLAQTLLHRPKVLILDEPTNGLDPAGIKQLRDILKHFAHEEGVAVIVSSHLMSEMELMCDRVGIISKGEILMVKTLEELKSVSRLNTVLFKYRLKDTEKAKEVFAGFEYADCVLCEQDRIEIRVPAEGMEDKLEQLNEALVKAGCGLLEISIPEERHLEDVFLELTGEGGEQIA